MKSALHNVYEWVCRRCALVHHTDHQTTKSLDTFDALIATLISLEQWRRIAGALAFRGVPVSVP